MTLPVGIPCNYRQRWQHSSEASPPARDQVRSSPAELVPHLVQIVSRSVKLCLHVATAAVKLRLHGLHLVAGESKAALQVLILLLEDSG